MNSLQFEVNHPRKDGRLGGNWQELQQRWKWRIWMSGSREAKHPRKVGRRGESKGQLVQATRQRASLTPKQPNWVGSVSKKRKRLEYRISRLRRGGPRNTIQPTGLMLQILAGSAKGRWRICWASLLNLMRNLIRSLTLLPQDPKQPRWRGRRQRNRGRSWKALLLLHLGGHTTSKIRPSLRIRILLNELNGRLGRRCLPQQMLTKTRPQKKKVMKRAARRRIPPMRERKQI
mmetsp:Transcript_23803/g.40599  ORF Transcript_23803/g.40599 Transcript_23803/m.40599 type:complete len:232 (-) Transcript_23803:1023-1718(-)